MSIIANKGSVQDIDGIPEDLKALYKTVWEISQKRVLEMAADRGVYIDQSQSLNVHIAEPSMAKLTSNAFLWLEIGSQNGNVLLENQTGGQCHTVHGRQD